MTDAAITLAGEKVLLMPEHAMFWPDRATLFAADLHFGKMASLRARGAPVPGGSTTADLDRLTAAIARTGARHLVVLGDWAHARAGHVAPRTHAALTRWREVHPDLAITLVRGNHDLHAGDPAREMQVEVVLEGMRSGPFALHHKPAEEEAAFVLAGHIHPGAVLRGRGHARVQLPCFLIRPSGMVLPAFGSTTGLATIRPGPDESVYVVIDGAVLGV